MTADILNQISSKWWTFLVRGLIALALAAFVFAAPAAAATGLVYVFAAYFIISGVTELITGISLTGVGNWWALVLLGLVQAALGVIMLAQPGAGPLALAYLFAIWMVTTGSLEIAAAYSMRGVMNNGFWWILLGVITLAFGFYVVVRPDLGLLALVYTVGAYAFLAGVTFIALAFWVKNLGRSGEVKGGAVA